MEGIRRKDKKEKRLRGGRRFFFCDFSDAEEAKKFCGCGAEMEIPCQKSHDGVGRRFAIRQEICYTKETRIIEMQTNRRSEQMEWTGQN